MTEKLYYAEPGRFEFDAAVISSAPAADGRFEVVLDRTCFYPGGGGQPCDRGTLDGAGVLEVREQDGEIVHVLPAAPGQAAVHGAVDAARRRDFMEQHTGQHIFSQALVRAGNLETVSVHFGDDDTTIEIKADTVDDGILRAAEQIANAAIRENRRVILHEIDRAEASRFPLRRTPPDEGRLRIVEVDSYDWAACGGVHVATAGEVFLVKAVSQERIRGRVRIHVMIGSRAFRDYGRKVALTQELSRALTCGEDSIARRVLDMLAAEKDTARELRRLRTTQAAADAEAAVPAARRIGEVLLVRRVFEDRGSEYLKAFVEKLVAAPGRIALAADRGKESFQWMVAHSLGERIELSGIAAQHFGLANAKGGGRGARVQGAGSRPEALEAFMDGIEAGLIRALAGGERLKLRIRYNSPVILTYALVCAVVLLIDQVSGGVFIRTYFQLTPDFDSGSFLSWLRLFTYVIGHQGWAHLVSNFSFILLIGPVLEEKYGSVPLLGMMLVTALATAVLNLLLVHTGLFGASGIVFMLILLSSFTNIRQGEIPITLILIIALYVVREFVNALNPDTVSQLAHIFGGVIGGAFGFLFSKPAIAPALPAEPAGTEKPETPETPEKKE